LVGLLFTFRDRSRGHDQSQRMPRIVEKLHG
jgi:hypothetical protein